MRDAPFFHLPRYAGKRSNFRSINSNSKSAKYLSENVLHGASCCCTRYSSFGDTHSLSSSSSDHQLDAANGISTSLRSPFQSSQNFTAAPFELKFKRMRSVDFWGWQGPLINCHSWTLQAPVIAGRQRIFSQS